MPHLLALGHQRIALIDRRADPLAVQDPGERQAGYWQGLTNARLPLRPDYEVIADYSPEARQAVRASGQALPTPLMAVLVGSDAQTSVGSRRVLGVLLALYACAIFGYVAATLATFFVGRDVADPQVSMAGAAMLTALQAEIAALHAAPSRCAGRRAPRPGSDWAYPSARRLRRTGC